MPNKKVMTIVGFVVAGIVAIACSSSGSGSSSGSAPDGNAGNGAPAGSEGVPADPGPAVLAGTLLVGAQIQPGIYQGIATGACYVERSSAEPDQYGMTIIDNDNFAPGDAVLLNVQPTDYSVDVDRECGLTNSPGAGIAPPASGQAIAGTLLVGGNIQPGTYTGTATGQCYVERTAAQPDEFGMDIIDNANYAPGDSVLLNIDPSDWAVKVDRECGLVAP
jgi:hypothetical protein